MSAFDDFNDYGFDEAASVFGVDSFTIGGIATTFEGVLNEFGAEKQVDFGGLTGTYTATIIAEIDQFDDVTGPLERTLDGRTLVVDGRIFKINRCLLDDSTLTIGLTNPNKTR